MKIGRQFLTKSILLTVLGLPFAVLLRVLTLMILFMSGVCKSGWAFMKKWWIVLRILF